MKLLIHPRIRIGELDAPRIGRAIYEARQIPISARAKAPDLEKGTQSRHVRELRDGVYLGHCLY